jgi:hypothetical protein
MKVAMDPRGAFSAIDNRSDKDHIMFNSIVNGKWKFFRKRSEEIFVTF